MSEMSMIKFVSYTTLGSLIWNTCLICIGAFAGNKKDIILNIIDKSSYFILAIIIVVGVIYIYKFYKKRLKNK